MHSELILLIIILIISFDYFSGVILSYLNFKSLDEPIPEELNDIYEISDYKKSQEYNKTNYYFGFFYSTFSFLLLFLVFYFGLLGDLDLFLRNYSFENEISLSLLFFGSLFIIYDIITIPFQLYRNFIIEEKYGFNKMTLKTFFIDKLKTIILTVIIGGVLMTSLLILILIFPKYFWIYFWIVITIFMLFINLFYTSLVLPLFNNLKPLGEGLLKDKIKKYAKSVEFPLTNIFIIDGSKRSSKANAFFSGFGKKKKIVLYDTLIKNHTDDELLSVLAHEVGHYKMNHVISNIILSVFITGFMLYLFSLILFNSEVTFALGGNTSFRHFEIFAFSILYTPISSLLNIIMNIKSRKNEYEADNYAVKTFKKIPLINALRKLSKDNLINLTPNPTYVFVNYSHPTLYQRIQAMKNNN